MLWLCLYLPRLPLDAQAEAAGGPAAVVVAARGRRRLLACNDAARALGIADGMEAGAAQAIAPALRLQARNPRAEAEALEGLGGWAYQFSDRLILEARETDGGPPFAAVLLEIEGSLALFGGLAALRARVLESFAALGYAHRSAIAPTPAAAEALARAGDDVPVATLAELPARLAPLPLAALGLPPEAIAALRGVGARTAGECFALPRAQLARRFGADVVESLRRLLGERADPRPLYRPPETFRRRCELSGGIESVEALLFPLRRLLLELEGVLVARDTAVLRLALELSHETAAPTRLVLHLAAPRRDAAALHALWRERLERATIAAPVQALVLEVEAFAQAPSGQRDFFDTAARFEESTQQLVERLVARLGPQAVRQALLRDDYRPEKSFVEAPYPVAPDAAARGDAPRPLWLLPEPRPLRAPPPRLSRPERIESGWWDGHGVARDYYVAETAGGSRLWVYREQDRWFLHGIWA